jgi:hypothetical protein
MKKMTLVSVPGLSFLELGEDSSQQQDLTELKAFLPHLKELKHLAAWGALNIRVPGRGMEDVYISMGAGQLGEANAAAVGIQSKELIGSEEAGKRYLRFTGILEKKDGIVVPQIESIKRSNASNYYHAQPGLLGQSLEAAGIPVSVWGNLDLAKPESRMRDAEMGKMYRRYAPFMLMNASGQVPYGDVSSTGLVIDASRPFGIKTNYSWLMDRWKEQPYPSVVLLELGDLQRLYEERESYSKEAFLKLKQDILMELDHFIGNLAQSLAKGQDIAATSRGELWLMSPQVNAEAAQAKALLAPIMMYSPALKGEALLTSATTRRNGLITAVDIAPTLLKAFGLNIPKEMIGLPAVTEASTSAFSSLLLDLQRMQAVYAERPKLLYGLAVYEIVVMLAALVVVWFYTGKRALGVKGLIGWRTLLYSLLLAPLGLLLLGWTVQSKAVVAGVLGSLMIVSLLFAVIADRVRKGFIYSLAAIGLLVAGIILYDGYHGAAAMQRSVLGYDPMIGARYYGIGNEFMGVLLGAALLGLTALQQVLRLPRLPRRANLEPAGSRLASGALTPAAAHEAGEALQLVRAQGAALTAPTGFAAWRLPQLGALTLWLRGGGAAGPAAAGALAAVRSAAASSAAARAWAALPVAAAGLLIAGYLASPALGTNAGGALAAAAGFGALAARLAGGRRWLRLAPLLALLLAAALAGLWLLNAAAATGLSADKMSHIGRAFEALLQGRLDAIGAIIVRKLQMNWHLIGVSAWSKVLLTSLVVMAALVLRPRGLFRRWQRRYPYLMYGCAANVIGTIAALLLNDSGIVAAATMIIYGSIPLLLLKLESA